MQNSLKNNLKIKSSLYTEAALQVLEQVKLVTDHYLTLEPSNKDETLLNIYGLLQTLFVGVDALYDFVKDLTDNKYLININQNDKLHELKFIRNDVVGHPTSRMYSNNRFGFCILDMTNMTISKIKYSSYLIDNKTNRTELLQTKEVDLFDLIAAYQQEATEILRQVILYLQAPYKTTLVDEIKSLDKMYQSKVPVLEQLDIIAGHAIAYDTKEIKSQNRLLWRIDLLKTALQWHSTDKEINNLIDYIIQFEIQKILQIALTLTGNYQKLRRIKLPYLLKDFYRNVRKNQNSILPLLTNTHDNKHPFHETDLLELIKIMVENSSQKIINLLINETNEQRIYLLGSMLKRYNSK